MKCKDVQDKLLLDGITEDMKSHLNECSECNEFSKIVLGMNDVKAPGPSAELDAKILNFAKENRPSSKQPIPFYILTAVAALLIVAFSVMLLTKNNNENSIDPGLVVNPPKEQAIDNPPKKKMIADTKVQDQESLEEALDSLWDDDIMSADITAIEGELFVLSAELYSN